MSVATKRGALVGETIAGRYRILRQIGEGATGAIYEIEHLQLGRSFSLKTLSPEFAQDRQALSVFQREVETLAQLHHPNIGDVVDLQTHEGVGLCIVTEQLVGDVLATRLLRAGPLDWPSIARLGQQILSALAAAHAAGITHRGLKPLTIFLARDDAGDERAVLLDFGVAGLLESAGVFGAPMYMAPEQAEGRRDDVGPRTDAWSAGAILFEMAAGEPPYARSNGREILHRICHGHQESLAAHRSDAPPAFERLVRRALSPDPSQRIEDVVAMSHGLDAALSASLELQEPPPTGGLDGMDAETTEVSGPPAFVRDELEEVLRFSASAPGEGLAPIPGGDDPATASWRSDPPAAVAAAAPAVETQEGRSHLVVGLVLLAVFVVLAAGGVTFVVLDRSSKEAPPARAASGEPADAGVRERESEDEAAIVAASGAGLESEESAETGSQSEAGAEAEGDASALGESGGAEPDRVTLRITSEPSGAKVTRDGRRVGKTPLELLLPRSDAIERFRVRRPGYHRKIVKLSLASGGHEHVKLRRRADKTEGQKKEQDPGLLEGGVTKESGKGEGGEGTEEKSPEL